MTEHERQPFERALDGGSAVLAKGEGFDAEFQRLGLNDEAAEIVSKIDGTRSAAEIAGIAGKDIFNTYKLLEGLRALGLLHKAEPPKDDLEFESAGVADAADAWSGGDVPQFQTEPEPPVQPVVEAAPVAAAAVPTPAVAEENWGFDEAQIETVEKAAAPPPPPTPVPKPARRPTFSGTQTRKIPVKPQKSSGAPVFALIVIVLLAAVGFGGWYWWNLRQVPARAQVATKHPVIIPKPAPPPPPAPAPVETASVMPTAAPRSAAAPLSADSVGAIPPGRDHTAAGEARAATQKPAAAPKVSGKYAAMAAEFARNPKGNFTLQFELVCQEASLSKAVADGGENVWFVPTTYRSQPCYRVFWGHYDTHDAATAATTQIPAALHSGKPVVVAGPK